MPVTAGDSLHETTDVSSPLGGGGALRRVPVVLASASPRRAELLGSLGVVFRVAPADVDETPLPGEAPDALALRLARSKAAVVAAGAPGELVIAADTVVAASGRVLEKPRDAAENREFARFLSGREHEVFTGHALALNGRVESLVVRTGVTFRALTEAEIEWYAATGEGLDKAGGYALQGRGAALVEGISGCWSNVVGLSLPTVLAAAGRLGALLV